MPEYADFFYTAGEKCGLADMGEREVENGRSADQRCLRILHVNFGIERGGIETWLARLIRRFKGA